MEMKGKIKKILAIAGKTQRGNRNENKKTNHIVSIVDEAGFCMGQKRVDEKSNEITAIPDLLDGLNVKGHIITTDAMGTQTEILKKNRKKHADYVLVLKGNQGNLYEDVKLYFADKDYLEKCEYSKTVEKARGGIEKPEYSHTNDIVWLPLGVSEVARAIRGHWMVESYHWHPDVTFREDDTYIFENKAFCDTVINECVILKLSKILKITKQARGLL